MENKLGRGLSALFGEEQSWAQESKRPLLDITLIETRSDQPRRYFDQEKIDELARSIQRHGLLQPVVVRPKTNINIDNEEQKYELIAGERRYRACKQIGLAEIPANIINCSDEDVLAMALVENIQRADLNPIEEAAAIKALIEEHKCTHENLSFAISKSRSYITNSLRLLTLPEPVQELLRSGKISVGHAKSLIGKENAIELAALAFDENLSVRNLEELSKGAKAQSSNSSESDFCQYEDPDALGISHNLSNALGLPVSLKTTKAGAVLMINCKNADELEYVTGLIMELATESDKAH